MKPIEKLLAISPTYQKRFLKVLRQLNTGTSTKPGRRILFHALMATRLVEPKSSLETKTSTIMDPLLDAAQRFIKG